MEFVIEDKYQDSSLSFHRTGHLGQRTALFNKNYREKDTMRVRIPLVGPARQQV